MSRMTPTILLLATLGAPSQVLAYPLPEFDSALWCSRVTGYGAYTRKTCTDDNLAAKAIAKAEWSRVPAAVQESCAKGVASMHPGGGSYQSLRTYLQRNGFAKD